jgi:hypothetical protein
MQVAQAFRRSCELETTYLEETGLAAMAKAVQFFHCLAGELRHGPRTISLENNARRMCCRAAGIPEFTFFDDDYIGITAFGEFVGQ